MRIDDLRPQDQQLIEQIAVILVEAFRDDHPLAWPDLDAAREEVRKSFAQDRISRVASDDGNAVGWIGGIEQYDGHGWELHPLGVSPRSQRRGIGAALVADLETQVRARGASVIYLGTDDENDQTSLAGVELFPGVLGKLRDIRNLRGHAFEFYLKQGYEVVGVIPHANGFGKPDILMAKAL